MHRRKAIVEWLVFKLVLNFSHFRSKWFKFEQTSSHSGHLVSWGGFKNMGFPNWLLMGDVVVGICLADVTRGAKKINLKKGTIF